MIVPRIGKRWEMVMWMFSGTAVAYTMRVNVSVAVDAMKDELSWSLSDQGLILSSFFWGYALGQIPGGRLAHRYGAKRVFAMSIFFPAVLTLLFPAACELSFGLALTLRALTGLCASPTFPCCFNFFYKWVSSKERPSVISTVISGMYFGEIVGFSISGWLTTVPLTLNGVNVGSWRLLFYVFGLLALLWVPLWMAFVSETPEEHPTISPEELAFIRADDADLSQKEKDAHQVEYTSIQSINSPLICHEDGVENPEDSMRGRKGSSERLISQDIPFNAVDPSMTAKVKRRAPWIAFFTTPETLNLLLSSWVLGWINFMLLTEMPSYLTDQLDMSTRDAGIFCILPFITLFAFTVMFGKIFEYLQTVQHWSIRSVRVTSQTIAFMGPSLFLLLLGTVSDVPTSCLFLVLGQALLGAAQSGIGCAYLDISPYYSARYNTVGNALGAVGGIVSPIVVSSLLTFYPGKLGWMLVFSVTAVQALIALIMWYIYQTSNIIAAVNTPGKILDQNTSFWSSFARE